MIRIDVTNVLFLDIETVCGVSNFEELDPTMQVLWADKASKIERRELTDEEISQLYNCLLYTSPSPRDATLSRMPSSA